MTTAPQGKPKTQSGTPAGTGQKSSGVNIEELMKQYQSMGGSVSEGPKYTNQDAETYVQNVYQQMLGRNAVGAQLTKAINAFLGTDADAAGRQQAVVDIISQTPEFKVKQENNYLEAIYNRVAQDVRKAQA